MIDGFSADRWRDAAALFHELVELEASSRSERLTGIGNSDPELRAAVEALLDGDAIADEMLPQPGLALTLVGEDHAVDALGIAGQTLGRFRVVEQIAWGGMGVVYRAEDLHLHRTVALKFPLLDHGVSDVSRALTLHEARAAGALDHPNLCPIYEVGESAEGPFFVMPLYGGETLRERIARAAPLDESVSLTILEQLAAGLACAHAAGIIHCDIKPANIMLLPDGTVKLLDFGLARAAAVDAGTTSGVRGTVAYMAPEQLRNEPMDARADLWALGVILYEMLSGSRPFAAETTAAMIDAVLESQPEPLAAKGVPVAPSVQELVDALLAKDPRARLQTAETLARAIADARNAFSQLEVRRVTKRRIAVIGGVLAGTAVLAAALWLRSPPTLISSGKLSPHDTIVLADFQVAGLDSSIGDVLNTLLRRDYADSRGVSLMSSRGVSSALTQMRRPPGTPVTLQTAREIAEREQARAVLSGRTSRLPTGFLISLRLIESTTGNELASFDTTVSDPEHELLPAVARASQAVRRAIGESRRGASSATARPRTPLTTTSLEAARLLWAPPRDVSERIAAMRVAIQRDTAFAYAWLSLGNILSWSDYRSAALDSAFTIAYRYRDEITPGERAQVTGLYWGNVQRNRRTAIAEFQSAFNADTTILTAVPLNLAGYLNESRQFQLAEALGRRIAQWKTGGGAAGDVVRAQVAQGKFAAADSTVARLVSPARGNDAKALGLLRIIVIGERRFDSLEVILRKLPDFDVGMADWIRLHRLRGRLAEAHRMLDRTDSASASRAAAAGARFDPASGRALALAREALWIEHEPAVAAAQLDARWKNAGSIHDVQDRIDGIDAAALYAAVGRPTKARDLLAWFEAGADTIAKRGIYEHRQAALAEIALADGRFADAMRYFRDSDLAADGLPATRCAVFILPHLARVAERAGWSDSARVFWEDYLSRPADDRLSVDQWFLATAYQKLRAYAAARGDAKQATAYYTSLIGLRSRPRATP
jgi:serine/threonine protein kinase